jgi:hypothetical protein
MKSISEQIKVELASLGLSQDVNEIINTKLEGDVKFKVNKDGKVYQRKIGELYGSQIDLIKTLKMLNSGKIIVNKNIELELIGVKIYRRAGILNFLTTWADVDGWLVHCRNRCSVGKLAVHTSHSKLIGAKPQHLEYVIKEF